MANTLAHVVLLSWPLVTLILFRRLAPGTALAVAVIAGYLLLPEKPTFNFPLMPAVGKREMVGLSVLVIALLCVDRRAPALPGLLPRHGLLLLCAAFLVLGPLGTVLTNGDTVQRGIGRAQTGLTLYDVASMGSDLILASLVFFTARRYLADPATHRTVLIVLCGAAVIYAWPALWEVRMSPRLNSQIYGFFPHDWRQHMRDGGFRPLVFLRHGLLLGIFLALGILAAAALWRISLRTRRNAIGTALATLFLLGTLVLSKNLGATLLALLGLAVILLLPARRWLLVAALLSGTVFTYPMLRSAGLVPTDAVVSAISRIAEPGRILSLEFRLRNEDALLEKANDKPLFGWGRWGRAQVYENGQRVSTTDGAWIIAYGEGGLFGYASIFGLLCLPPILLALRRREEVDPATAALTLILAINLVDLLPNSGLSPVLWMLAGALAGRLEWVRTRDAPPAAMAAGVEDPATGPPGRRRLPYARRFPERMPQEADAPPARRGAARTSRDLGPRGTPS
jgi:hypothetical protein